MGDPHHPSNSAPIDAIIVLGAAVWSGGRPSPALERRTKHAIEQFHTLLNIQSPPMMVLSGGLGRNPPSEAEVMANLCREAGINGQFLILEDRSTSTFENAVFSAELLPPNQNLLIVSDRYHLPRALMVFRNLGFQCRGSGPRRRSNIALWKRPIMPLREALAFPYYWALFKTQKTRRKPG